MQRHRAMVAELHAENNQLSAKALDERRAREMVSALLVGVTFSVTSRPVLCGVLAVMLYE